MLLNLTKEEKEVFEWAANKDHKGESGPISLGEAMEEGLEISDPEKLKAVFQNINKCCGYDVVVLHDKGLVDASTPHVIEIIHGARNAWEDYKEEEMAEKGNPHKPKQLSESDPTILSTNTSDISVSFNPGDGSESINIFSDGASSDLIAKESAANTVIPIPPEQLARLVQIINQAKEAEVGEPYVQELKIGGGVNVNPAGGITANAFFSISRGQKKVWRFWGK